MLLWAHPSPQPKWHLDQFSRFCKANGRTPIYFTMGRLFPPKLPLPMGYLNPNLIHGFLSHLSPQPKWYLCRFSHFCRAHHCDRRQTDHTTTTTTTVLRPFFRDHPGEPVPEVNFWTLRCKGRLTEADTPTIRLGATPSGLTSAHLHHPAIFYRPDVLPVAQPTVSKH